jgi:hypothetical protein
MEGRLPLDVVFTTFAWSPKAKFQIWRRSDQWLLRYSYFSFLRSSYVEGRLPWEEVSNLEMIRPAVAQIFVFFIFEVVFHGRLSSIKGRLHIKFQ